MSDPLPPSRKDFLRSLLLASGAGLAVEPAAHAMAGAAARPARRTGRPPQGMVQVLNVRDAYGAVGDGLADDTAAIQRAINDAAALGLNVYLPAGRYRVSRLLFHHDPVRNPGFSPVPGREGNFAFFGDGPITRAGIVLGQLLRTVIESDDPEPPIELDGNGTNHRLRAVSIGNMTIRGNNASSVLRLVKANTFVNLGDLLVHQRGPGGGILIEDTWVDTWTNVYVLGEQANMASPSSRGLVIRNLGLGGGNVVLLNVSTDRFNHGWEIGQVDYRAEAQVLSCVTCIGCQAARNEKVGVLVGKGARSLNWIGSHVENASNGRGDAVGMLVKNFAQGVNVSGSFFSGCDTAIQIGDNAGGAGENTARLVSVHGNNIVNCLGQGVRVHGSPQGGRISIESNGFSADPNARGGTIGVALEDTELGGVSLRYNVFPEHSASSFFIDIANRHRADLVQGSGTWTFHRASPTMDGTWNGSHLVLGATHLWVDAAGKLRMKQGAPSADLDGALAGAP